MGLLEKAPASEPTHRLRPYASLPSADITRSRAVRASASHQNYLAWTDPSYSRRRRRSTYSWSNLWLAMCRQLSMLSPSQLFPSCPPRAPTLHGPSNDPSRSRTSARLPHLTRPTCRLRHRPAAISARGEPPRTGSSPQQLFVERLVQDPSRRPRPRWPARPCIVGLKADHRAPLPKFATCRSPRPFNLDQPCPIIGLPFLARLLFPVVAAHSKKNYAPVLEDDFDFYAPPAGKRASSLAALGESSTGATAVAASGAVADRPLKSDGRSRSLALGGALNGTPGDPKGKGKAIVHGGDNVRPLLEGARGRSGQLIS